VAAVTYAFFHADVLHWAVNMVFLVAIGPPLERAVGTLGMLAFFFLGAAVAGLLHLSMVYLFVKGQADQPLLGASGGIMALLGAYSVRYYGRRLAPVALPIRIGQPRHAISVSAPVGWLLSAWLVSEVVLGGVEIAQGRGSVAHWAHVGGFLAGMTLAVITGLQKTGRREEAIAQKTLDQQARRLAEYLREQPEDAASRLTFAGILVQLGDRDRAARAFVKAMDIFLHRGLLREAAEAYMAMRAAGLPAPDVRVEVKAARAMEETAYPLEALAIYDRLSALEGEEAETASLRAAHLAERIAGADAARRRYQAFLLMFPHSQFVADARRSLERLGKG
jgi:membrane associated rhomboid family serine protease